jgi:hypothetical protein
MNEEDYDIEYFKLLARYSKGCPAQHWKDICDDPANCAANGHCRDREKQRVDYD